MRIARLSFLLYSLSLVAVTSGQSALVSDVGNLLNSGSASASPTETSTTDSATETSTSETPSPTPTETSTTDSSSPTPTSDSTTSTSSSDATTTTDSSSTGTTTSDHTTAAPSTITTIHTISGTPLPTTMTSAADDAGATSSPSLSTSSKDSSDSGLSSQDKKVIIGVVVGVGGALIIGVLGVVIWRIRSKKGGRNDPDEAADLMSGTAVGTGNREKAPSPGAPNNGTPFRSTLDQYHNPGNVNAASNF